MAQGSVFSDFLVIYFWRSSRYYPTATKGYILGVGGSNVNTTFDIPLLS